MLKITLVNHDTGAVMLNDGTRWTVSRDDTWAISPWEPRHRVVVQGTGVYRRLENLDCGSAAEVILEPPVTAAK